MAPNSSQCANSDTHHPRRIAACPAADHLLHVFRQHAQKLCRWIAQQQKNLQTAKIAVLYASAYGNTASLAQTISRGITKAGVGVEMVNLEQVKTAEVEEAVRSAQGFCIGVTLS
jgi:flavorubredoxin